MKDCIASLQQRRVTWLATLAPEMRPEAFAGQEISAAQADQKIRAAQPGKRKGTSRPSADRQEKQDTSHEEREALNKAKAKLETIFEKFLLMSDEQAALPTALSQTEINCIDAMFRDEIIDAKEKKELIDMVRFTVALSGRFVSVTFAHRFVMFCLICRGAL